MKDKLQDIGKRLLKNINMVAIIAMVVIVGLAWYYYDSEQRTIVATLPSQANKPWVQKFDAEPYSLALVDLQEEFVERQPRISEDEEARRLIQINMFDAASVADAERIEEAVRADFAEAQTLRDTGQTQEAIAKLQTILQRYPQHQRSRQLLIELERQVAEEAAAEEGVN